MHNVVKQVKEVGELKPRENMIGKQNVKNNNKVQNACGEVPFLARHRPHIFFYVFLPAFLFYYYIFY